MYQVSVLLILNFEGRNILSLRHEINTYAVKVKNTIIFNAFVLCRVSPRKLHFIFGFFVLNNDRKYSSKLQVFNEFNIFKGVTKNYLFMGIVGLAIVIQVSLVTSPLWLFEFIYEIVETTINIFTVFSDCHH